jgi:histidinol-phosphate/aromatic aminotransferase/cobyric acid decarboxylase-like protein
MRARHSELIAAIRKVGPTTNVPGTAHIMGNMAEFLAELAEDVEKQTAEDLQLQRKLLRLTHVLAWLTVALFIFTAFLCYDAYRKSNRDAETQKRATQQRAADHNVPTN